MARYFAGNYLEACRIARALDDLLVFVPGMLTVAEHALYQCLSITAAWHDFTGPERAEFGQRLDAQLRVMAGWAESCPRNFAAMHLVVSAEHARVHGDAAGASERY
jgi:hypothetical protein